MMFEPLKYKEPEREAISWVMAMATMDGWEGARWSGMMKERLTPDMVAEFTKITKELIKQCPEYTSLSKFFRKHGKQIRCDGADPTLAFAVSGNFLNYIMEATGPNLWIEAHHK